MNETEYYYPEQQNNNPYLTPVNLVLVGVNVVVFLILSIMGSTEDGMFMYQHGAMYPEAIYAPGEWYRMLTSTFLHFGLSHLVNNMVMMILLGSFAERALGRWKYLLFYLACGVISSLVSSVFMIYTNDPAISGGASGAIFGIIGALLYIILRHRGRYEGLTMRRFLIMLALSLYYGFRSVGVDNAAHLGGLGIGFLLAILFYRMDNEQRTKYLRP